MKDHKLDPIEPAILKGFTKAQLISLCQKQNTANHHIAAKNVQLTNQVAFNNQSLSVTVKELETEVDQLTESNNLRASDLITMTAQRDDWQATAMDARTAVKDTKQLVKGFTIAQLSRNELLTAWGLTQSYLADLHNNDEVKVNALSERFAEHVSLQRRLEVLLEGHELATGEPSC